MGLPLIFGIIATGGTGWAFRGDIVAAKDKILYKDLDGDGEVELDLRGAFNRASEMISPAVELSKKTVKTVGDTIDITKAGAEKVITTGKQLKDAFSGGDNSTPQPGDKPNPFVPLANAMNGFTGNDGNGKDSIIDRVVNAVLGGGWGTTAAAGTGIGMLAALTSKVTDASFFGTFFKMMIVALPLLHWDKTKELFNSATQKVEELISPDSPERSGGSSYNGGISIPEDRGLDPALDFD